MPKKYEHNDFHESYYDHGCSIIQQKDVLETDIIGNDYVAGLKRWWNGLFLLSYGNHRSRIFYTSSHAIRMERIKQFRRYKNRIHPLSKFRNFWDNLMISVFICDKLIFHYNTSIFTEMSQLTFYLGAALELIIIFDTLINIQTGYIDQESRKVILNTKKTLLHYCSTKLFMHTASVIPLHWIMFVRYGSNICCDLCKTNYFMCTIRIIHVFTLYRVYETTQHWTQARDSFKTIYIFKFLRIGVVGFITMLQFCDISDTINIITIIATGEINEDSYISLLIFSKFGLKHPPPNYKYFCIDFARICKSLLLFSFGFTARKYYLDEMTSLVTYIIANFFYMWCLMECYSYISRLKYPEDKVIINRTMTLNLVKIRQLPDKVSQRVHQYYDFKMARQISIVTQNGLYIPLPDILKKELVLSYFSKYVWRISYFIDWPTEIKEQIVLMLKEEVYLRNDIVIEPLVSGEGLIIVGSGELATYSIQEKETGHLIDGDYFGELSLVTDNEVQMSYVVANTPCTVLLLEKSLFRQFMRQYPQLFFTLRDKLIDKFNTAIASVSEDSSVDLDNSGC